MATITQKGDGWQARVRRKPHKAITRSFSRKLEAERWAAETEAKILSGRYQDTRETARMVMADLFAWYIATVVPSHADPDNDLSRLKPLQACLASTGVLAVTPFQIVDYALARIRSGKASGTVRRELGLLSDIFACAITFQRAVLPSNPVTAALIIIRKKRLIPPPAKRSRRLWHGELQRLCAVPHSKPTQIVEVMLFAIEAPMREGEIAAMRRDRVDWERSVYYLDRAKMDYKTGQRGRVVPLSPLALDILRALPVREDGKLWAFGKGGAISLAFRRSCASAGIEDLHFHDLRHEGASIYGDRGYNVFKLMAVTGHKDVRSVQRYTHLDPEKIAAEMT